MKITSPPLNYQKRNSSRDLKFGLHGSNFGNSFMHTGRYLCIGADANEASAAAPGPNLCVDIIIIITYQNVPTSQIAALRYRISR